jgi:hypothetical protein
MTDTHHRGRALPERESDANLPRSLGHGVETPCRPTMASRSVRPASVPVTIQGARVRLGEEQIGNVRARDGQQHGDREREQHHHQFDRPDHRVLKAVEAYGAVAIRVGIRSLVSRRLHRASPCQSVHTSRQDPPATLQARSVPILGAVPRRAQCLAGEFRRRFTGPLPRYATIQPPAHVCGPETNAPADPRDEERARHEHDAD